MTPDDLAAKQAEMQVRSQEKASKRNKKNASVPRSKKVEALPRGTRRPLPKLLGDVIARPETHARCVAYLSYMNWCFSNKEKPPMWSEFFGRWEGAEEDTNRAAEVFKYPLPDIPAQQQTEEVKIPA